MDSIIDISNGKNILCILPGSQSFFIDTTGTPGFNYIYGVTALDRLYNESEISNTTTANFSQLEIIKELATENKMSEFKLNSSKIIFSIVKNEIVNLSLFNQNGEKISNLLNEELKSGEFSIKVNFKILPPGRYFYKLTTPSYSAMKSFTKNIR
jgi:O-glycosyl hydrolase